MSWKNKKIKGFTIIEMLVAVSILVIAIEAPLFIASKAIIIANTAKNKLEAEFLMREGLEYIRNVRDTNLLMIQGGNNSIKFDDGFSNGSNCLYNSFSSSDKGCKIDIYTDTITKCTGPVITQTDSRCGPLKYEITAGGEKRYGYSSSYTNVSPFTRTIQVQKVQEPPPSSILGEDSVMVFVSWMDHGNLQTVSAVEYLFELQ